MTDRRDTASVRESALTQRRHAVRAHLCVLTGVAVAMLLLFYTASVRADTRVDAEMCDSGTGNLDLDRSICERAAKAYGGAFRAALLARKAGAEIWLGKYEYALRSIDEALEAFSGSALAYFERGRALRCLGRLDESVQAFNEATTLWQGFTITFRERGLAQLLQGQFERADADLSHSIELRPA